MLSALILRWRPCECKFEMAHSGDHHVTRNSEMRDISLIKILVATDCHLGYEETDPIIGEDSFITFEEVLTKALDEEVDFILLGGDLFHHNNPSQKTMKACIDLMRQYTLGSQNIKFEMLSKAKDAFSHCITQTANFLDENINVSMPVFSIHGNHDDPSGLGQLSSLDTLSSAGLVNYFGKWTDLDEIKIKPIIIRKCNTYVALYGLSHIKDDRLCRLFLDKKVTFLEPEIEPDKCFRILVLHQNRADRGPKRFISESFLPSFFDIVIWGHEHDCEMEPIWNIEKEFYVLQPGSTVVTSLSEGEAKPKHVVVIRLWEDYTRFDFVKLNTVRPFIWRNVRLPDVPVTNSDERDLKSSQIMQYCTQEVEQMIKDGNELVTGHPKQPKVPLIRLRCEYTDETQLFNIVKFGQQFLNRVATPNLEIIKLKKIVEISKKKDKSDRAEVLQQLNELYGSNTEENQRFTDCVNRIITNYFTEHPESKMKVLQLSEMGNAVEKYIEKDEQDAINYAVEQRLKKVMGEMMCHDFDDEEEVEIELERMVNVEENKEIKKEKDLDVELRTNIKKTKPIEIIKESDSGTDEYDLDDNINPPVTEEKTRSVNVKQSRIQEKDMITLASSSDSEESIEVPSGSGRGRGGSTRGRGRGRGSRKTVPDKKVQSRLSFSRAKEETKNPSAATMSNSIVFTDSDSD